VGIPEYSAAKDPFFVQMNHYVDSRGNLFAIDFSTLPFEVKRFFTISVSQINVARGEHAHKECWQALFPIGGKCNLHVMNTSGSFNYTLDAKQVLIVPPFNWCSVNFDDTLTIIGVFASHSFDPKDYISIKPKINPK
jgi:hypothetical protein